MPKGGRVSSDAAGSAFLFDPSYFEGISPPFGRSIVRSFDGAPEQTIRFGHGYAWHGAEWQLFAAEPEFQREGEADNRAFRGPAEDVPSGARSDFARIIAGTDGNDQAAPGFETRIPTDETRIQPETRSLPRLDFQMPALSAGDATGELTLSAPEIADGPVVNFLPPEQTAPGTTIDGKPVWDLKQIYENFFRKTEGDGNDWETLPLTYSFPVEIPPGYLDASGDPYEDLEGVGFSPFFIEQRTAVVSIMDDLGELIAPEFTDGGWNGDSVFRFANTTQEAGSGNGTARANGPWADVARRGDVWIYSDVPSNFELGLGGDGRETLIHEIGHILGLAHPGDYDASDNESPTYKNSAEYYQDSEQYTIMSYFGASNTGNAPYTGEPDTFLLHDIYALQRRYGAELNTRAGDTTYGFNATTGSSTISQQVYNFDFNHSPRFTIWDAGGDDTIDASGFTTPSKIDLRPGSFSSIGSKVSGGFDIPQGERMVRIQIEIASDLLAENQENFSLEVTGIPGDVEVGNLSGPVARGEIWSQIAPRPLISASDAAVEEGGDLTFIVSLDHAAATDVTVDWEIHLGSASASDLAPGAPLTGTLTIPGGDTEAEISVGTVIDGLTEGYETLELQLSNPSSNAGIAVDLTRPLGHVGDAGVLPLHRISISDARGVEPVYVDGSETEILEFVVTLDRAYHQDLELDYTVVLESAQWADFADLRALNNNISIAYDNAVDDTDHQSFEKSLVWIENAIGGAGDDELTGNEAGNFLSGNEGDDWAAGGEGEDLLLGGEGNDTLHGEAGNDSLLGDSGNDRLIGGDGDDLLEGGAGDDWMTGEIGDDTFIGGAGFDTVDFSYSSQDWTIDLTAGTATFGLGVETLSSIEAVTLEEGDDVVTLSDSDNFVFTGSGNDMIHANGLGTDTINASTGTDHLSYALMDRRVTVDLGVSTPQVVMFDVAGSIEHQVTGVEHLTGTAYDDDLAGNLASNQLFGLAGEDRLEGVAGDNLMDGGAGNDTIFSGQGKDSVIGGAGIDFLSFEYSTDGVAARLWEGTAVGAWIGTDTWIDIEGFRGSEQEDQLEGWVQSDTIYGGKGRDGIVSLFDDDTAYGGDGGDSIWLDLDIPVPQSDAGPQGDDVGYGGNGGDYIYGGWGEDLLFGGAGNDELYGDGDDDDIYGGLDEDELFGGHGNDALFGDTQNDRLNGGDGNDQLDGGSGEDIADYTDAPEGVIVNLNIAGPQQTKGAGIDTLISIEGLDGSAFGDVLFGQVGGGQWLRGNDGDDELQGGIGDDVLYGGNDNDVIRDALGDDLIYGGAGIDWLDMSVGSGGAVVDLGVTGVQDTGGAGLDWISGIENLIGTSGNDHLTGSLGNNIIRGRAGNDTIDGDSGHDTLRGDAGDDLFIGSAGADSIDGGAGNDTIDYSGDGGAIFADLIAGTVIRSFGAADQVTSIEAIVGTAFADSVTGGAADETLHGGGGGDSLSGGDGNDTMIGANGADVIDGGRGDDSILAGTGDDTVDAGDGSDEVFGSSGADSIHGGRDGDVIYGGSGGDDIDGGSGDDQVYGSGGADSLNGGSGNDIVNGGTGQDQIYGGTGNDTLSGSSDDDEIHGGDGDDAISGGSGADAAFGRAGQDTISGNGGHDRLYGGSDSDTVSGDGGADTLFGGNGADLVRGGDGDDTAYGGGRDDTVEGGEGEDLLYGSTGNDTLDGGAGNDLAYGGTDDDRVDGGTGSDRVFGAGGDDTVLGAAGGDSLYGGTGNDTVSGGSGDDFLFGSSGEDVLTGGSGNDTLNGGSGADLFVFEDATWGQDTITGWQDGLDLLDFTAAGLGLSDFGASAQGGGTLLTLVSDPTQSVFLDGIGPGTIDTFDFV